MPPSDDLIAIRLQPGAQPFASGRDADVYDLGDGRVLRRYRGGGDVTREAELMRYVASYGFPVPVVHAAAGPDLVLERLDGPTLVTAVAEGNISLAEAGRILAELHERLHGIPAPSGTPGLTVVHGDLHPENVVVTATGPVLIDWRSATEGPAELDLALTAVITAEVALMPGQPQLAALARDGLARFLAVVPDPSTMLDRAIGLRAQDRNPERGRDRAPAGGRAPGPRSPAARLSQGSGVSGTSTTGHWMPGTVASRRSPVISGAPTRSASARYDASYALALSRSSHIRSASSAHAHSSTGSSPNASRATLPCGSVSARRIT